MGRENALKSREVSAMIKQGFIADPTLTTFSFSPSRTFSSPPFSPSSTRPSQTHSHTHTQTQTQTQTLFDMMSEEHTRESKFSDDKRRKMQDRVLKLLDEEPFRGGGGDVKLTVVSRDGFKVSMDVHKRVLADKSRFFAEKLRCESGLSHSVEISDCDDVEVYVEAVVLMHSEDLKRRLRLMGEGVSKVLSLLKVSAAIMFDLGVESCLEYLEAIPWTEDEQEEVISQLGHLQLHDSATQVLHRVSSDPSTAARADDIFMNLLNGVLQAKDDKARREMKALISRLLKENASNDSSRLDVSKDTLYHLCHRCISSLVLCLSEATGKDERPDRGVLMSEITREADNIQWIVDILIGKKMGDEFVKIWAEQKELATLHSKVPTVYRHEISRITAQLCIGIGRGHILVPKEIRFSLLSTWLEALYEDFGWMRRASRAVDKKLVEDGLSQTILTLPLLQQQSVLLNWFDRFLNKGDDCPNIQKAFEIWWRRAFIRQYSAESDNSQLQITLCDYPS
ncbi:BTB/POZ domain-containing protein At5g60050 [Gastrolobium bilobum]|uniref:BTB/POZ domain-containing protein At5g60050 n=1 Tax=Gastrolobium bilobum TaxID=150636 RepID=UPI002AB2BCE8|nr:BTB/POZ domain-containing protein At5g60050 [Gastrolobium bilobum]